MVLMNGVDSIAIPEGDARAINGPSGFLWGAQDYLDVDILPYVQDQIGWWNVGWTTCAGFNTDTNWSYCDAWIPACEGKLVYKLYLHSSVGHLTAWDASGTQLGYINGSNSTSMAEREWVLPTGTKWLRICIAYPKGGIGSGRDQRLRFVGKSPLPRRYQRLDGITSFGAQYIDTGVTPNANHIVDMWLTPTEPTGDSKFFGMYGGSSAGSFLGCYNSKWRIGTGLKNSSIPITGDRTRAQNQASTWYWGKQRDDIVSESCAAIATGSQTYLLFGCRFGGTGQPAIQYGKMTCHLLRIAERQNASYTLAQKMPICCMIPCRDLQTGELGMYDFARDTFFGNLGTGAFAAASI